ncbi:hypothetical protein N7488_004938 [Penicillium malachiteum]|nr:hypothetical protein N7488_004938 [Penicillium malachiteum]
MAFQGERFVLDLDDDESVPPENPILNPFSLIGEIKERNPAPAAPPAPTPTASSTGFPAHRRRNKPSSFKQRRAEQAAEKQPEITFDENATPTPQDDKKSIAEQNSRQLASMSEAQIEHEREELIASMDPSLLERFLRRAKIEDGPSSEEPKPKLPPKPKVEDEAEETEEPKPKKSVSFDIPAPAPAPAPTSSQDSQRPKPISTSRKFLNDDLPPTSLPQDLHPASEHPSLDPATLETFHFPPPKQPMPTLDPNSPNFLSDMQSHYFPELSHDPAALSWLKPLSADEEDPDSKSPYHPASDAVAILPSAIRFSLRGTILAPETSLSLPTTLGLHHHGEDPHAAGYTIPELAILSRSTFPAQRCVAWQVIGRILFRLGRAEFGDRGGPISEGLWHVIEKEGVVGGMLAEAEGAAGQFPERNCKSEKKEGEGQMPVASGIGRHASAAAWAVEGVWLWQQGGGGDRGFLKEGQIRSQ